MREIYYSWALREAMAEEMERDPNVFILGEDIAEYGGAFKVTQGLAEKFGRERVRNTPISENTICGVGVGAAIVGMRPVVDIMFQDFITLAMDQIVNHAAKFHYMYGGQCRVPMVIRTPAGGGRCYGPTHSQSLEAWLMHVPGIKVVAPATAYDAKGLLKSAIRDDNPVFFVESKLLYGIKGEVPEPDAPDGDYTVPIGEAKVTREGAHLTLIAYSRMTGEAEKAADALRGSGIDCDVVDLRTLAPLDGDTVAASVEKTGRALVIAEDCKTAGVSAEVMARVSEECFDFLKAPVRRVAAADTPVPCADSLEKAALPDAQKIIDAAVALLQQYP
ncbi:MAG: alpha-ketoacid dehydrogenase subunit beta [Abitibacteriaceae bacterium]|nr:alpha-ketoacid dehydrogenase subunit beta [Abditibacteriaceae bacterium]